MMGNKIYFNGKIKVIIPVTPYLEHWYTIFTVNIGRIEKYHSQVV